MLVGFDDEVVVLESRDRAVFASEAMVIIRPLGLRTDQERSRVSPPTVSKTMSMSWTMS